jgi:pimeloyl-ACP methyl ester carboxylesterase
MARRVGPAGLLRQLRAQSTRVDRRMELGALDQPTLVISGGDDHVCPVALQEELADGLPRSTHLVLDGVGHMAPLEAPDVIAAHLRRWLDIGF